MRQLTANDIERLGRSLRLIRQPLTPSPIPGAVKRWYQGPEPYFDLVLDIVEAEQRVMALQLTLRGHFLRWHHDRDRIETGYTSEPEVPGVSYHAASTTLQPTRQADSTFCQVAHDILETQPDDIWLTRAAACLAVCLES